MFSRRWLGAALALALIGYGIHLGIKKDRAPGPRVIVRPDAGVVAATRPPPPVSDPTAPPGDSIALAVVDAVTGAPWSGTLMARSPGSAGSATFTSLDPGGFGHLELVAGRWTLDAGGAALVEGHDWTLGDARPPLITVRIAAEPPLDDPSPPPPPAGAAVLVGVASLGAARSADLVVQATWLGELGPGRPVTTDRIPQPRPLPPRRFIGTSGAWKLDGLAAGTYAVRLVEPGRGAKLVRATATNAMAGDASATLEPAAGLSGTVVDQRGGLIEGATVRALSAELELARTTTTTGGTYLLVDLPPGTVKIDIRAPKCFGERTDVVLEPGKRISRTATIVCDVPADAP